MLTVSRHTPEPQVSTVTGPGSAPPKPVIRRKADNPGVLRCWLSVYPRLSPGEKGHRGPDIQRVCVRPGLAWEHNERPAELLGAGAQRASLTTSTTATDKSTPRCPRGSPNRDETGIPRQEKMPSVLTVNTCFLLGMCLGVWTVSQTQWEAKYTSEGARWCPAQRHGWIQSTLTPSEDGRNGRDVVSLVRGPENTAQATLCTRWTQTQGIENRPVGAGGGDGEFGVCRRDAEQGPATAHRASNPAPVTPRPGTHTELPQHCTLTRLRRKH